MRKMCIALLFGGVSSEHEVSRVSVGTFARNLDREKYELIFVGITKSGNWLCTTAAPDAIADGSWETDPANLRCTLSCTRADHGLLTFAADGSVTLRRVDVAIPVLHGRNGEDGTIQGLFEIAGIPYVGCGVLSSAVCMDKAVANALMAAAGLPHCPWLSATRADAANPDALAARVEKALPYPIFVKPANAGSSVGITKAHDRAQLKAAIAVALHEDDKLVFEQFVDGQEVECAVLGNWDLRASQPGEILAGAEFYTYDDKYKNGVSRTCIPANLAPEKLTEVQALAQKLYRALDCTGLARCDFFVEKGTGRVLVNEVNTMPGFTAISMYPQMMRAAGLDTPRLLDELIRLALQRAGARHE